MAALALLLSPCASQAQSLPPPTCAWQFEWTPSGLGNWLIPDTGNRWWYMPIDPQWQKVTIAGNYPEARFFSFAVYDGAPVSSGLASHLYDAQIAPNLGSVNPFASPDASGRWAHRPQKYTVAVTRTDGQGANSLSLKAGAGWLVYRLYLPNSGEGTMAGVPLPGISVTDARGQTISLPPCAVSNRQSELAALQPQFLPQALENPTPTPPVPDRVQFAPVDPPPARLLPNPDNKYLISYFMSEYDPDRLIVVRGRMPAFPDTYNEGAPITKPAPGFDSVQMRYWSMCLASFVSPLPVEGCAVDAGTPVDENGFYTVVISNDVLRPNWLPSQAVWIPWGDEKMIPKALVVRNLLPAADFRQSAQNAVEQGCGVAFNFPVPPTQEAIAQASQCTRNVMGSYYPVASWCDRAAFKAGGWAACFSRAGSNKNRK
jgi:hypothetical protein